MRSEILSACMSCDFSVAPFAIMSVCSAVARLYSVERWLATCWIWATSPWTLPQLPTSLMRAVLRVWRLCSLLNNRLFTACAWLRAVATGGALDVVGLGEAEWLRCGLGLAGLLSRTTATTAPAAMTAAAATSPPMRGPRERFAGCCGGGYCGQPGPLGPPGCG